ncbi:hypothetical protein IMZ48_33270, partial [Candidatus Bathyarchaeota archaeon]|nr:hypothetical protein [Candidatus Bathyarchaeota archaeon]
MAQTPASGRGKRTRAATNSEPASALKKRKVEDSTSAYGESSNRRSEAARAAWEKRKQASVGRIFGKRTEPQDAGGDDSDEQPTTPSKLSAKRKREIAKEKEKDPYDLSPDASEGATPSRKKKGTPTTNTSN